MQKRWVFKEETEQATIIKLIEELGVSRPLANLLGQRGIGTFDKARAFFRPKFEDVHDPYMMKNMESAVNRIEKAIAGNENILIYGDYDVDGTTAVALMYSYLNRDYDQIGYYIPDRYKEGYGISNQGVEFAIDNLFSLVIALDCGIKAVDEIALAKENGIDFIVCDHHTAPDQLPDAIILNPKQLDCEYPFKELCGCGVGFKLVQALNQARGKSLEEISDLLDLAMVSIGADIVSMTGENRLLASLGLKLLNEEPRIGLKKLLELANKEGELSMRDVVFTIAPRINAAGRIDSGNKAVELLLAETEEEVDDISKLINVHNETRKGLDREITEEALQMIDLEKEFADLKATIVFKEGWHKGVVGIVASRLMETHYRPTIVLTQTNGEIVGSARSVRGFNIYAAIDQCSDLLERYGGHFYAAGLTLKPENLNEFRQRFCQIVEDSISEESQVPIIDIDAEIDFRDIFESQRGGIPKFYRLIRQLAPFGPDNENPIFVSRNVRDTGHSRVLKEEHLKLNIFQEEYDDIRLNGIAFGLGHWYNKMKEHPIDIIYTLEENFWQGSSSLQLMVQDIRLSERPT